jgi:hypothetical protein
VKGSFINFLSGFGSFIQSVGKLGRKCFQKAFCSCQNTLVFSKKLVEFLKKLVKFSEKLVKFFRPLEIFHQQWREF